MPTKGLGGAVTMPGIEVAELPLGQIENVGLVRHG